MGRYLTPDEAAAWLGVSRTTLYRLLATAGLPSVKLRHRRWFVESALEGWFEAQLTSSPAAPAGATPPAPASSPAAGDRRGSGQ